MNPNAVTVNHVLPPSVQSERQSGRIWPVFIVALLLMNASIVAATVFLATSDKSAVTEPDYYAKAVDFENAMRIRDASARLGWRAVPALQKSADGNSLNLVVSLTDADGKNITGAQVSAVTFSNLRSGDRQRISLFATDSISGQYGGPIRIDRAGIWNIRIRAVRGGDTFLRQTDLFVPDLLH